jgi:hypothetical protein
VVERISFPFELPFDRHNRAEIIIRVVPATRKVVFPLTIAWVISSGVVRSRTGGVRSTVTIIGALSFLTVSADTRAVIGNLSFTTPVMGSGSVVHVDHVF